MGVNSVLVVGRRAEGRKKGRKGLKRTVVNVIITFMCTINLKYFYNRDAFLKT